MVFITLTTQKSTEKFRAELIQSTEAINLQAAG